MIAYLAHPIDLAQNTPIVAGIVDQDLRMAGFTVYRPAMAFGIGTDAKPNPTISMVNETALRHADVIVVLFPEDRTIGTVLEMAMAVQMNKPMVILSDVIEKSWSLAAYHDLEKVMLTSAWSSKDAEWLRSMVNSAHEDSSAVPLRFRYLSEKAAQCAYAPSRQYPGDAGFDLYVTEDIEIPVGQFRDVPCGVATELPPDTWGLIIGRSSTLRKHNLMVTPGVIDNGYRGPLYAGVYNMNGEQFSAKRGMRLAQFIPFPLTAAGMIPIEVSELTPSDRGVAGFGSTGE